MFVRAATIAALASLTNQSARAVDQPPFFIGLENCLAVEAQQELTAGARLVALAAGQRPRSAIVRSINRRRTPIRGESQTPSTARRDCAAVFREDVLDSD